MSHHILSIMVERRITSAYPPHMDNHFDVIVIGAGAAGMMCAAVAGARGRRVLLLDHADRPGKKILISGGGRCNFTNLDCQPENFLSDNRHFAKSALARYTQHDFIEMVEHHGIAWHEKTLGQLFCDGSAREIVAMLLAECEVGSVDLRLSHRVTDISKADAFRIVTDKGIVMGDALVLASGSLSIPKMGATGFAHDIARKFGLALTDIRPALVPLTFSDEALVMMQPLSGVSLDCEVLCGKVRFREAMLLTHRGLSGPAILQISSYWREGETITVDLVPDGDAAAHLIEAKRNRPKSEGKSALTDILPGRLAAAFATDLPSGRLADMPDKALKSLGEKLDGWRLNPSGTEGYAKAEVTLGGIDTKGLDAKTMQAKSVPGLYAIGEAVDVTGWLGGYNFQWAWSSGWAAGQAV